MFGEWDPPGFHFTEAETDILIEALKLLQERYKGTNDERVAKIGELIEYLGTENKLRD